MLDVTELPVNDPKIEKLKTFNKELLQNKGQWSLAYPGGHHDLSEMGYELCATIKTFINPEQPFEFQFCINEKNTDEEMREILDGFHQLTDGFEYTVS